MLSYFFAQSNANLFLTGPRFPHLQKGFKIDQSFNKYTWLIIAGLYDCNYKSAQPQPDPHTLMIRRDLADPLIR